MAIQRLKVTYNDGREIEVLASPRAKVMTEERVGDSERWILGHFYLAWASLFKAGKESLDFEPWLDQITDVDELEEKKPDPTQGAPSAATSSDSPS